jgi:hypothetical protein
MSEAGNGASVRVTNNWSAAMNVPTPHYINEHQSDMRGIKEGWYAIEYDGNLAFGPFSSREDCLNATTQPTSQSIPMQPRQPPNR